MLHGGSSTIHESGTHTCYPKEHILDYYLGDPIKCRVFYRCVKEGHKWVSYKFDCPSGTLFDLSKNRCDHGGQVDDCDQSGKRISQIDPRYIKKY